MSTADDSRPPSSAHRSPISGWAQLVRLPNVFTVLADVSAGFLLVAAAPQPLWRLVSIMASGVALYWAGMILNDVFDVEDDRAQRPTRPIPAGSIALGRARVAGWSLLLVGIALAGLSGYLPGQQVPDTWIPMGVATALAVMIVAYDGPLKRTRLAPAAMGSCRVLSFLLGASPCLDAAADWPLPKYLVGIAFGFGVYVMGITTMARQEATGGPSPNLAIGLLVIIIGAAMLALAPQMAPGGMPWHISPRGVFPIMIGMTAFPVVLRGLRAVRDPTPVNIQTTIRVGIFTIIPLAAWFAFLGAGAVWGVAVFLLTIPSIMLATRFRVT